MDVYSLMKLHHSENKGGKMTEDKIAYKSRIGHTVGVDCDILWDMQHKLDNVTTSSMTS